MTQGLKLKYKHIACGGTFDFFHAGHISFLKKAFSASQLVSVGITSDHFATALGKKPYNSFSVRKLTIEKFLFKEKLLQRSRLVKLEDIFGTTTSDRNLQGIIVTENSKHGALKINAVRRRYGLKSLDIIACKLKKANDGSQISSTKIKSGIISPDGINYFKILKKHNFGLPRDLRSTLGKPFGNIVTKAKNNKKDILLISVGDQTTRDLLAEGIIPNVSVVDYKIQRVRAFQSVVDIGFNSKINVLHAKNPQGFITKNLSGALEKSLRHKRKSVVVVDGEEDLSVLPAVLLSPIGASLYYGLRNKGLVNVIVDVACKNNFWELLNKFTIY